MWRFLRGCGYLKIFRWSDLRMACGVRKKAASGEDKPRIPLGD